MTKPIEVTEYTTPTETLVLLKSRDATQPTEVEDISAYTIKLIVKADVDFDDDQAFFELEATIVDGPEGVYRFDFGMNETSIPPGTWPGEIRIWTGPTTDPAADAIPVNFTVVPAVKTE